MIGQKAEKRRHQKTSYVRAGHLDADHSLGFFRAEMARRGMDNGRIDRRASKSHQDQTGYRKPHPAGDQKKQDPDRQDPLSHPDQRIVLIPDREESIEGPANGDPEIKQSGKTGRPVRGHVSMKHQIAAAPKPRRLFQRAVSEKAAEGFPGPRKPKHLARRQRKGIHRHLPGKGNGTAHLFPKRQAEN